MSDTGNFIWYELMSPDPDGSKAFYDAVVGWDIEPEPTGEQVMDYRMIRRSNGGNAGGVLRLTDEMASQGARPAWLGYLNVDDVDATVSAVEADGGRKFMAADIQGVGRIAMVADPQGAPFYVMKPNPPAGDLNAKSDVFSVDQPQHVRWNELATSDQDEAQAFYSRHFGIRQEGAMAMGEMGEYRFIFKDGIRIGAIMRKPPQMPVSLWSFYFGVDDIDRAGRAISDGGGTIHHGPNEIPGGEYTVIASDPHGASFGIVGQRKV